MSSKVVTNAIAENNIIVDEFSVESNDGVPDHKAVATALLIELNLPANEFDKTKLSDKQIGEISQACVDTLTKHGYITMEL